MVSGYPLADGHERLVTVEAGDLLSTGGRAHDSLDSDQQIEARQCCRYDQDKSSDEHSLLSQAAARSGIHVHPELYCPVQSLAGRMTEAV